MGHQETTSEGRQTGDAIDEAWESLPTGVTGPVVPTAGELPVPVPVPVPVPERTGSRDQAGNPMVQSLPPEVPAPREPAPVRVAMPVLGAPRHSGARPPLYPSSPGVLPPVRSDFEGAVLPDIVVDGATRGPLTVRAASVRGDSHRYEGEPRQDALCVTQLGIDEDGLLLLAVADGVGSARRSHVGSNDVCRNVAYFLDLCVAELAQAVRQDDEKKLTALVNSAVGRAAEGLAQLAARRGEQPDAYATTLRALLVPLDPAVRNRGFFAVGDGGIALLRNGAWRLDLLGEDSTGSEIIDTRTAALPGARYAETRVLGPTEPGDVIVLCTDGLSTPLAGVPEMRDFLEAAWGGGAVPEPADFLWQLQYRVKSYDDDRTAVCLWDGTI